MKPLVAVHGSYFANNFGDTLLVKLLCDRIAAGIGRDNVFLAVPGDTLEQQYIGYPVLEESRRAQATHLVYAGGGYLGQPNKGAIAIIKWSWRNWRRHFAWAGGYRNARTAFIGVGFGPLTQPLMRWAVRRRLARASDVLLRDQQSVDFFRRYRFSTQHLDQCVDFALSLKRATLTREPRIGLHLAELTSTQIAQVLRAIAATPELAGHAIEFFSDSGHRISPALRDKYNTACLVADRERIAIVAYDGVDSLLERLARYALAVTCKLHVGIVSIALGGKVLSVPVHHKTRRLYAQLGLDAFCLPRDPLSAERLEAALALLVRTASFEPSWGTVERGLAQIERVLAREFPLSHL